MALFPTAARLLFPSGHCRWDFPTVWIPDPGDSRASSRRSGCVKV